MLSGFEKVLKFHALILMILLIHQFLSASPVILGLHQKNPLTERQMGSLLVDELRCAACHEGFSMDNMRAAPVLDDIGLRASVDFIQSMILNPQTAHPGSTMPSLLNELPEVEAKKIAKSIASYLTQKSNAHELEVISKTNLDTTVGKEIFHKVGCVACHAPDGNEAAELDSTTKVSLSHLSNKYSNDALTQFLLDPLKTRPSGRMPSMKLTPFEAKEVSKYLLGRNQDLKPLPASKLSEIQIGREHFKAFNCAACHQLDHQELEYAAPKNQLNVLKGCLSSSPNSAPNFHLTAVQRKAIQTFIKSDQPPIFSHSEQLEMMLTKHNCIACHQRDDYGGVAQTIDQFFKSSENELGNEARLPPPLTLAGAKLRREWISKVLFEGRSVRPYMHTRMPQFGETLNGLADLFHKVDTQKEVDLPEPNRSEKKPFREGARQLIGDKGLNCIACHNFNGKESPGFKGLDLTTSFQRLQPSWFYHYMLSPSSFRPGIVMPSYWPNGQAVHKDILNGHTKDQIRAIWYYLSLGQSAHDPPGIRVSPTQLSVGDKAITYRGRNQTTGYRGIAVGLPGGLNYSFNAEYGALTSLWRGNYIQVNWRGQGSGSYRPSTREIVLNRDIALSKLKSDDTPWPLAPVMNKNNPVNPDPLYPQHHGYRFKGYFYDEHDVPTFMYDCHDIQVFDKTLGRDNQLIRELTMKTDKIDRVYLRVMVGVIEKVSDWEYKMGSVTLKTKSGKPIFRQANQQNRSMELLLNLDLKSGENSVQMEYHFNE